MSSLNARKKFTQYTTELTDRCRTTPSVIGLVLVGSVADTARVDEWSDHDFFVITEPGAQEALRQDLSWLPSFDDIAFSFRETAHGLKVVYRSGGVLEFAIFDVEELRICAVNHNLLAFGTPDVAQALTTAANRTADIPLGDSLRDFRLFLSLLVIGVGRARRGELLTAGEGIRSYALGALLKVFARELPADSRQDRLDPFRRFEFVQPELGGKIAQALQLPPEHVALSLLSIAEENLPKVWANYPNQDVLAVRKILGWSA
jgi:hypothetical protein